MREIKGLPYINNVRIVFFDGICNLCNHFVDWLIRHDDAHILKFASLQGETAKSHLQGHDLTDFKSVVYQRDGVFYSRSTAALMLVYDLGGWWRMVIFLRIIPSFLRNAIYDVVARNRYRWFGRRDTCRLPTPEEATLFLP